MVAVPGLRSIPLALTQLHAHTQTGMRAVRAVSRSLPCASAGVLRCTSARAPLLSRTLASISFADPSVSSARSYSLDESGSHNDFKSIRKEYQAQDKKKVQDWIKQVKSAFPSAMLGLVMFPFFLPRIALTYLPANRVGAGGHLHEGNSRRAAVWVQRARCARLAGGRSGSHSTRVQTCTAHSRAD